ncbi:hypothetical protein J2X12_002927 [Pseudarthrobacter oxydans]|uniref:Uncharacterized protein n=1 Tax=Pseudarthrobacter oxydans TaxID=1671 RepID=A0AAW8NDD0_PSEOX|nr:hypothetical protein [Pseudarthrobacter oxydans]MDR6794336.1 hypothetical protein [Pseudarthrobacter oxydans]MDR7164889.1 hypothetical protein [Pseudarthrobacter oxydans]
MTDNIIEAPIVLTLKLNDAKDSPWLVLRATNAQQLQSQLQELENGTLFADIGRVAAVFQAQGIIGAKLGAKGIDPVVDGGSFDNVQAALTAATLQPEATPPAAAPKKFPAFGGFKAAAPASTPPPATAEPVPSRIPSEPPAAAPAAGGFPAAPAWKKP